MPICLLRELIGLILLLCGAAAAQAAGPAPPAQALELRIETTGHNRPIRLLALGHATVLGQREEVLASAADDDTVRLWRALSGALLRVLYLPSRCRPARELAVQDEQQVLFVHGSHGTCAFDMATGRDLPHRDFPAAASPKAPPELLGRLPKNATAVLPLPGGRLAFAAGTDIGEVAEIGEPRHVHRGRDVAEIAPGSLQVNAIGTRVRFVLVKDGPWEFALDGAYLRPAPAPDPGFRRIAQAAGPGLRAGGPEVPAPSKVQDASLSSDGHTLVAALSDGTLRFYAAQTGRLLVSALLHRDHKRWVAWTPSGLYAAAPDGDRLVGFRADQGTGHSDFFPLSLFRSHLNRPAALGRMIELRDETLAAGHRPPPARRLLPPVLTLLSPAAGTAVQGGQVTVQVALRSPSGEPVQDIWGKALGTAQARTRGATITATPGRPLRDGEYTLTVDFPAEDCPVQVFARTELAQSMPLIIPLRWAGHRQAVSGPHGTLRLLAAGISEYRDSRLRLRYAAKDASDVAEVLRKQEGLRYKRVEARVLADEGAGREAILAALDWLRRESAPQDTAVIFLAGHGDTDPVSGQYAFLPQDVDPAALGRTALLADRLKAGLSAIAGQAGQVLLFLDTCHAGSAFAAGAGRREQGLGQMIAELQKGPRAVIVYSASQPWEASQEHQDWSNGAFTKALVEGLSGHADTTHGGGVTVSMLEHYVSERVRELTKKEQTPTLARTGTPDLEIARVRWPPVPVWASNITHYELAEEISQPVLLHRDEPGAADHPRPYRLVEDLMEVPSKLTKVVCQDPRPYVHQLQDSKAVHREMTVELRPGERQETAPLKLRAPPHRMDYLLRAAAIFDDPSGPLESAPIYRCLHVRPRRWSVGVLGRAGTGLDMAHNGIGALAPGDKTFPAAGLGPGVGIDLLFLYTLPLENWRRHFAPRIQLGGVLGLTKLIGAYPCPGQDYPNCGGAWRSTSWAMEARMQMNADLVQIWRFSPRLVVDLGLGLESLASDPPTFPKDGWHPLLLTGFGLELAAHVASFGAVSSTIRLGFLYQIRGRLDDTDVVRSTGVDAPGVPKGVHAFWFVGGGEFGRSGTY